MKYNVGDHVRIKGSSYVLDGIYEVLGADDSEMPVEVGFEGDTLWIEGDSVHPASLQYLTILEAIAGDETVDLARKISEALQ